MEKRVIFKNIDYFKTNQDLFINFAFFRFINSLGSPLLDKILNNIYINSNTSNLFFDNLKVKCNFEEKINNGKKEGTLKLLFKEPNIDKDDFSTFIYSKLIIRGVEIILNNREDIYDKLTSRIILSRRTLDEIHNKANVGLSCTGCELFFSDRGLKNDPILSSLINLYLNSRYDDKKDYQEKINSFVSKVTSDPKEEIQIFEIDGNGDNRIKYENFKKGEIYFLQGPPGTGKTYTITRLIKENEESNTYDKIIVSSRVHVAINNIIEHIIGTEIPKNKYAIFYDFYQYMTILYSNRALSKIKDSPASELIELDKIIDEQYYEKAKEIYEIRKDKSKELIDDFNEKIDYLSQGDFKTSINFSSEEKINEIEKSEKFKRIFTKLNDSGIKNIDYEKTFELVKELSNRHYKEFVKGENIEWGMRNYSVAIRNYSNVIFCSLDNLQKELDRQKKSDNVLVIIDEASTSNIIHYLLLLNNIDNITLLVLGDPEQLSEPLVFGKNLDNYSKIMTAFTNLEPNGRFIKCNNKYQVINVMKDILFELVKNKSNRSSDNATNQIGYENINGMSLTMWKEILAETFYETLFNSASEKRKELLNIHRRSRKEIFELSKFLYKESYMLGEKSINDNLLIPNYDVLTRIVIDNSNDSIETIDKIIDNWKNQKNKTGEDMTMGIITFYNDYKNKFEKGIKESSNNDISIYTVDSSQGEQFTTVILYLDVSPHNGQITDFMYNYHRINVAVSRAKEQLIIVETRDFLNEYDNGKKFKTLKKFTTFIDEIHSIPKRGDSNE